MPAEYFQIDGCLVGRLVTLNQARTCLLVRLIINKGQVSQSVEGQEQEAGSERTYRLDVAFLKTAELELLREVTSLIKG